MLAFGVVVGVVVVEPAEDEPPFDDELPLDGDAPVDGVCRVTPELDGITQKLMLPDSIAFSST